MRELRGVTARDVLGALREMDCMGAPAVSVRTLYHAAINTAPNERLSDEQKQRAADRLERELGLDGQPRIIVEHLKKGREHIHVVFLRIDTDRMVAIPDGHNYRKHEIVARELEREFGHQLVQGVHVEREGKNRPKRTPSHGEMQQAERTGFSPQDAKKYVTRLWKQADSGKAFAAALAAEGWVLANGDRRDFVLVDPAGEAHSLARRIEGVKTAEVRQRMADIVRASLPKVSEAKVLQREATAICAKPSEKVKEPDKEPIISKVTAPVGLDPARPLMPVELPPRPIPADVNGATEGGCIGDRAPELLKKSSKPAPTARPQSLYMIAVKVTNRVYEKAKGLFHKKQTLDALKPHQVSRSPEQSVRTPLPRRLKPKQPDVHVSKPIAEPLTSQARTINKLTRKELDEMIGRQRDRPPRRSGPSR